MSSTYWSTDVLVLLRQTNKVGLRGNIKEIAKKKKKKKKKCHDIMIS